MHGGRQHQRATQPMLAFKQQTLCPPQRQRAPPQDLRYPPDYHDFLVTVGNNQSDSRPEKGLTHSPGCRWSAWNRYSSHRKYNGDARGRRLDRFLGQVRVGQQWPGHGNQVRLAICQNLLCQFRVVDTPHQHDRYINHCLSAAPGQCRGHNRIPAAHHHGHQRVHMPPLTLQHSTPAATSSGARRWVSSTARPPGMRS